MSDTRNEVPGPARTYFVTGYPGFIGKRLVEHIVREAPQAHIYALVQPKHFKEAQRLAAGLRGAGATLELLTGDIVDMHLGLSGDEYQRLCARVTHIFHLAAVFYMGVPKETAWRVNVDGTRNVLELARDCEHLERFNHFSSCHVSGDRVGVIAEDELDCGQSFRNVYEETKFHAEQRLQRAAASLPITLFRPSTVVGDSRTGEIDRFEGPYYLGVLLVTSPLVMPMPLPGNGVAPLNVVPVDYVVKAVWALGHDERAVGRTFHLVDPNPMSARRVYERIAEQAHKKPPRFNLSARAADVVMRLPVIEKLARPQRAALAYVNHLAIYNSHNTQELLDGTGIRCPPLSSYLDQLVAYVREQYRQRREQSTEDVEDPLDQRPSAPADTELSGGRRS
ncbi:MAG: SDR family oxidoreductase [Cystobacter sp.]